MTTKPEVVLHIGLPKTGTTFLQNSLAQSRQVLGEFEVAYHQIRGSLCACHWWFMLPFVDNIESIVSARIDISNGVSLDKLHKRGADSRAAFQEEIQTKRRVVVSAEQFFFMDEQVAEKMREYFKILGVSVRIVAYVRDPVEGAISEINQKVKMGQGRLDELCRNAQPYEIEIQLERFSKIFGTDSIIVRPYQRVYSVGARTGDIVDDFCHHFLPGVDCDRIIRDEKTNTSLCREALLIIDECNSTFLADPPHSNRRDALLASLPSIRGTPFRLNVDDLERLRLRAAKQYTYLRDRWEIEFQQPDLSAMDRYESVDERAWRSVASVLAQVSQ